MVRIFWHSIRVLPIVDHTKQRGTTWLELFAFFALNGGTLVVQPSAKAHLKVKFLDDFNHFKTLSRALFKFVSEDAFSLVSVRGM